MTNTATHGPTDTADPASTRLPHRRRGVWIAAGVVVVVAVAVVLWATDPFGRSNSAKDTGNNTTGTSLATVTERSLSSQTSVDATLGYAGSRTVTNQAAGTLTRIPSAGTIVHQGHSLYDVDGSPVVLLYGATPAYRALSEGMTGTDVRQLNHDLVALGDTTSSDVDGSWDAFSAATAAGVEKLQKALGVTRTGSLAQGQVVFLPSALRVTTVSATLGGLVQPGTPVITGTSIHRKVTIALDADLQSQVKVGDKVVITLPDNATTAGVVSKVGKVATTSSDQGAGSTSGPTISVLVTPTRPAATGTLDQAPVQVEITTATVHHALVVPVTALLALSGGGYAVEVVPASGPHQLVAVQPGIFDDADELVAVSGSGLTAGQHVVVPSS